MTSWRLQGGFMRTISLSVSASLITALLSVSAWATSPSHGTTSHPVGTETSVRNSSNVKHKSSLIEREHETRALSGSGTEGIPQREPMSESRRLAGGNVSGSNPSVSYGHSMQDLNKALEMCQSLNPKRECTEVSKACLGQADLEACVRQQSQ